MFKVLITGGSGLLGQYLNFASGGKFEILTVYNSNKGNCIDFNSVKADLRNEKMLNQIFSSFKPDIVIHTAAITNPVPEPDQNSKLYYDVNVNITKNIAGLCSSFNSKLIYISTDLVYAGYRGSMLKEDAKLIPVSLYAETKLMGEMKIRETIDNFIILRTGLLYGFGFNHSQCHFHYLFDELRKSKPVKLFVDQFRTPVSLKEASRIIIELAGKEIKTETINLGGLERVSRFELGEMLCKITGFDKNLLQKITMDEIPNFPKVEDVSLNTEKLRSFGLRQKSIEESVKKIFEDCQSEDQSGS